MSDDLARLYQAVILDHGRHPRNRRALDDADHRASGDNPLCGDEIHVALKLGPDGTIADIAFEGHGCAIALASASLMTELVKDRPAAQAWALMDGLQALATGADPVVAPELGDALTRLQALSGVRDYPSRIKCATLAWRVLDRALGQR